MPTISGRQVRKSNRFIHYDYSRAGAYFITICTHNKECLFGEVVQDENRLNEMGEMIWEIWKELPKRFPKIELDQFVVMPNHFHGIILINDSGNETTVVHAGEHKVRPYGTLPGTIGRVIQAFKSLTTREYIKGISLHKWPRFKNRLWQRNYYEHVIRTEKTLEKIREYIVHNPLKWDVDPEKSCRGEPCVRPRARC